MDMDNDLLLYLNAALYVGTFFVYQYKKKYFSIGSFVLLFYAITSLIAIDLFRSPFAKEFHDLTLFPFIYLYIALMMCFSPLLRFKDKKISSIRMPDSNLMNILSVIVIISFMVKFLTEISSFSFDNQFFDPMSLAENYKERERVGGPPGLGLSNALRFLSFLLSDTLLLFLFYNMLMKNRLLSIGIILSLFSYLILSLSNGDRYYVFNLFIDLPFLYLLFRHKLAKKAHRIVSWSLISVGLILVIAMGTVTMGRYGNNKQGEAYLIYSLETYAAQNFIFFNNYGLDAGGIRYGDNTANLLKKIAGLNASDDQFEGRIVYSNLKIDNSRFYTFVGDFTLDYGPIVGFLILMLMTVLFSRLLRVNKGEYHFNQIVLLIGLYHICVHGFSLFTYSFWMGNIKLIVLFLLYALLGLKKKIVFNYRPKLTIW
ncbi:MAG: oligosaccharide repeat unit polymerase [Prevotellaceae bacterium]|jgi:oligosaccharide repeat unit polymerase|nr:oligosaccharide repeat unit polymerase [Prevotellaceae bacterium]